MASNGAHKTEEQIGETEHFSPYRADGKLVSENT